MEVLYGLWDVISQFLTLPQLGGLAAMISITFALYKNRRLLTRWRDSAKGWAIVKCRRAAWKACSILEIATKADLNTAFLESKNAVQSQGAPLPKGWRGPKTILRAGVRFDVDAEAAMKYLGNREPHRVDERVIDAVLQGPFCRKCHHTLVTWNNRLTRYVVEDVCPNCKFQWHLPTGYNIYPDQWKSRIYQALDAEFRDKGTFAESDVAESPAVVVARRE